MNRTRERGSLGRLLRENTKTSLNVILHHVRDDSGFSRPNVGRYDFIDMSIFHKLADSSDYHHQIYHCKKL